MIEFLKPYLRAIKMSRMVGKAERNARRSSSYDAGWKGPSPRFIVGCGRSGTTILGRVFLRHPDVMYFFEPYHLWANVDRRCDLTNLYYAAEGKFIMDAEDRNDEAQLRFNRLFGAAFERSGRSCLIEKTPHNIGRLGYLESLAPGARYVHIIRSGIDVARSIERLATRGTYRMAGKARYNQWWGTDLAKWRALERDGARAGYFAEEIAMLETDLQRGVYEWLVSMGEADRWRERLGDRLVEITYQELTQDPREVLARVCEHFGLSAPDDWLGLCDEMIQAERRNEGTAVSLPRAMCERFNAYQEQYSFEGRAQAMGARDEGRGMA